MTNRKYAKAVLEGNQTERERMQACLDIILPIMEKTVQILFEDSSRLTSVKASNMQVIAQEQFARLAPDLTDKYRVILGTVFDPATMRTKLNIGYVTTQIDYKEYREMWGVGVMNPTAYQRSHSDYF